MEDLSRPGVLVARATHPNAGRGGDRRTGGPRRGGGLAGQRPARQSAGDLAYFAVVLILWYVPIFLLLKALGIGMDWVDGTGLPPSAALLGALIGAVYCGLPTAVLFGAADAATNGRGTPSEFARTMNGLALGLVLPSSLAVGGLWAAWGDTGNWCFAR